MTRRMSPTGIPAKDRLPFLTLAPVLSTGLASLDQRLPGGGWPLGGLVELIAEPRTVLPALLPALRVLSLEARWVMLIQPPAPVLARLDRHHAVDLSNWLLIHEHPRLGPLAMAERALLAGTAAAVVVWADELEDAALDALRRAQDDPETLVFVVRPPAAAATEPAGLLRVRVSIRPGGEPAVDLLHAPWSAPPATRPAPAPALNG